MITKVLINGIHNMKEREIGCYWVWISRNVRPIIGYWNGSRWLLHASECAFTDDNFYEIDEKQIKRE
jgi:hypothetical protein